MGAIREKRLALALLAVVLLVNAVALWPEISNTRLDLNDNVSHYTLIRGMADAIEQGRNPLDFWSPESIFGYPEIRVYQPLAHGIVVLLYFALGKTVSLMTIFVWVRYLSVVLLPASFFAGALLLELPPLTAAAAAAIAPLVATNGLYGVDDYSFVWRGLGLFPQAVATHLLLFSIGFGFRAVRRGTGVVLTGALLGLTALCHLIYGYMGALTMCLVALLPDRETSRLRRITRVVWMGSVAALLSLFQLLPLVLDQAILNHSNTEPAWKWDSWGAGQVLQWMFTGQLLDYGRLPVLTLLAFAGAGWIFWELRRAGSMPPVNRFLLAGSALWILLFFGRPFWGPVLLVLGISPDMHVHRLIGGVHIFLILTAAVALARLGREIAHWWNAAAAVAAVALLLLPAVLERGQYLSLNDSAGRQSLASFADEQGALGAVVASLRDRGGRTYAGLWTNWGKMFNVGGIPIYSILAANRIPAVSYLEHTLALPADLMGGFNELKPAHYRLFGIQSVLTPAIARGSVAKFLTPRLEAGKYLVLDAPGGGLFDVVDAPVVVRTDKRTFFRVNEPWLRSNWPENRVHLQLDFFGDAPAALPHLPADGQLPPRSFEQTAPGRVIGERQKGEVYEAELDASRASFALFKMTWHPNWRVVVDGKPVKSVMLSPGFLGAPITAGRHEIQCQYEPGNWKLPVGLAGLLAAGLLWLGERKRYLPGVDAASAVAPEPIPEATPVAAATTADPRSRKRRKTR